MQRDLGDLRQRQRTDRADRDPDYGELHATGEDQPEHLITARA